MAKSDAEIAKEGDYSLFDKIFGQTSNNAAMKKLKAEAREKAQKVLYTEEAKTWLSKYGYPRAFPAYIDRSGEGDSAPAAAAAPAPKAAAPAKKASFRLVAGHQNVTRTIMASC